MTSSKWPGKGKGPRSGKKAEGVEILPAERHTHKKKNTKPEEGFFLSNRKKSGRGGKGGRQGGKKKGKNSKDSSTAQNTAKPKRGVQPRKKWGWDVPKSDDKGGKRRKKKKKKVKVFGQKSTSTKTRNNPWRRTIDRPRAMGGSRTFL